MMREPILHGVLPIERSRAPADVLAGLTLAALGVPEVLGYARIAGMPLVTGLYTMLLPMAAFAILGSSRHLVVAADSATAAILAAALAGLAAVGSPGYVRLAGLAGAADRRDAAGGAAGPAGLPGQLPVPHRAGRVPDRRRPRSRGRAAARHARGQRRKPGHPAPAAGHDACPAARALGRRGDLGRGHRDRAGGPADQPPDPGRAGRGDRRDRGELGRGPGRPRRGRGRAGPARAAGPGAARPRPARGRGADRCRAVDVRGHPGPERGHLPRLRGQVRRGFQRGRST